MPRQPKHTFRFTMYTPAAKIEYEGSIEDGIRRAFYGVDSQARREELLHALHAVDERLTAAESLRA
jgi:hypothetical protein